MARSGCSAHVDRLLEVVARPQQRGQRLSAEAFCAIRARPAMSNKHCCEPQNIFKINVKVLCTPELQDTLLRLLQ
jgi:hypothetical protein